jgi:hypothetical protein
MLYGGRNQCTKIIRGIFINSIIKSLSFLLFRLADNNSQPDSLYKISVLVKIGKCSVYKNLVNRLFLGYIYLTNCLFLCYIYLTNCLFLGYIFLANCLFLGYIYLTNCLFLCYIFLANCLFLCYIYLANC